MLARPPSPAPSPAWLARTEWALALAACVVAVVLHVRLFLRAGPLWRDEVNTVVVATQPTLAGVWDRLDCESFPLLPFALVRLWSALGLAGTEAGLRSFGLVVGLSCVAALWGIRAGALSPPLLALVLFVLNPVVLRWGDSVRGYGLGALAIMLAFAAVFRAVQHPHPAAVALAVITTTAAVQSLYQNSVLVFAIVIAAAAVSLAQGQRRQAAMALGIGGAAALSLLPYLSVMGRARRYGLVSTGESTPGHLASVLWRALGAEIGLGAAGQLLAVAGVGAIAWAVIAVAAHPPVSGRPRPMALYALLVLLIAIPAHFAFLLYLGFPTMPWYSLSLVALSAACLAAIVPRESTSFRTGRLLLAGALLVSVSPRVFSYLGLRQTNMDLAAAAVAGAGPDDFVVVSPWFLSVPFHRYYRGAAPWATIPPLADTSVHRPDLLGLALQAEDPVGTLVARLEGTLRGGHRVYWVGLPPPVSEGPPGRLPPLRGPPSGALQGVYCANWTLQVTQALRAHGAKLEPVPLAPHPPPQPYERARVWVATGPPP